MADELKLEDFLPYRLAVLSNTISTTVARAYDKRFSVSIPEWRVIAVLGRFPGLSAVEVAERTMMDKVAVSRAVTKLIKNGRIHREFADADEVGRTAGCPVLSSVRLDFDQLLVFTSPGVKCSDCRRWVDRGVVAHVHHREGDIERR